MRLFLSLFGRWVWGDGKNPPRDAAGWLAAMGFLFWALSPSPQAATYTWTQTNGGTYNWTDSGNWDIGGFPDAAGDVVVMTNRLGGKVILQVGGTYTLGTLILGSPFVSNYNYTLISNGPGSLIFSNPSGPALIWKPQGVSGVADYFALPITLGTNLIVTNQTGGGIEFNDVIREISPQSVDIVSANASGYVVFRQTNTFTGGAWLRAGATIVGANGQGATNNPTSGPLGSGTIHLVGGNMRSTTYMPNVVVINSVVFESNVAFPSSSNESTLTLAGSVTLSNGNRALTVDIGAVAPSAGLRITGPLGEAGGACGLIMNGGGNLWLTASNTYSGGTLISSGTLWVSNDLGESNVFGLGSGEVTNNSVLVLTATNGHAVSYGTVTTGALYGTGTNIILAPSLGKNSQSTLMGGNYGSFSGIWSIGPDAQSNAGKVRMAGTQHPSTTNLVWTNATLFIPGGSFSSTAILYGGDTGESLGQLRIEGNGVWSGPVIVAGPMTGAGDGHIGSWSMPGTLGGCLQEATPGAFDIRKSGRSNIILSGTNLFSGTLTVLEGPLTVGANANGSGCGPLGSNATIVLSNAGDVTLYLSNGTGRLGALSGGGNLGGHVMLGTNTLILGGSDLVYTHYKGLIQGTGRVIKVGTNWQYLLNTNTYTGGTIFSNGVIGLGSNQCLGPGPLQIFSPSKQIEMTNGSVLTNDITFYSGSANNTGNGVLQNPYSGTAWLSNGTIMILGGTTSGGHFGANLMVDSALITTNNTEILTRTGTSTFRGTNGYGRLAIGFGTFKLGRNDAIDTNAVVRIGWVGNYPQASTYLDLQGFHQTISRLSNGFGNSNTPVIGNGSTTTDSTLTLTGPSSLFGVLSDRIGSGTRKLHLRLAPGSLSASGTNTYSGLTTIDGGVFRAGVAGVPGRGGAFGSNSTVVLSNTSGSLLDLNGYDQEIGALFGGGVLGGNVSLGSGTLSVGTAQSNSTYDGVISGTGGLVKTGTGDLTLAADQTYTGATLISNGRLVVNGTLASASVVATNGGSLCGTGSVGAVTVGMGGLLAPGLPGTNAAVFAAASVLFQNGATYAFDLDGSTPTNDVLLASGTVACGGNLVATNVANSATNTVYVILRASNITGTFSGIPDNGFLFQHGRLFQVRYSPTQVTLRDIGDSAPPPVLAVTNPAPEGFWNGSTPLSGVASNIDASLASPSVFGRTNGGAWVALGITNEWVWNPGASNFAEGPQVFSLLAYLSNGLTNQITWTNIVDVTPPTVPTLTAVSNPFVNGTSVRVLSSDFFRLDRIFYTTDGSIPDGISSSVTNGGSIAISNACTLTVNARDAAGNWSGTNTLVLARVPNRTGVGSIGAVEPNPFRPGNGTLTVKFQRQNLDRVELWIHDLHGRVVSEMKAVSDMELYSVTFTWDGKNAFGQTAGRGMYLVVPKVGGTLRADLAKRLYLP